MNWEQANDYFDKKIEKLFKNEPSLPEIIDTLWKMSILFTKHKHFCLAIACSGAAMTYQNAGTVKQYETKGINQAVKKAPKVLSGIILDEKISERGDEAMEKNDFSTAFAFYNTVAENNPNDTDIWAKRMNALIRLLTTQSDS